jgi:hypothetical protein
MSYPQTQAERAAIDAIERRAGDACDLVANLASAITPLATPAQAVRDAISAEIVIATSARDVLYAARNVPQRATVAADIASATAQLAAAHATVSAAIAQLTTSLQRRAVESDAIHRVRLAVGIELSTVDNAASAALAAPAPAHQTARTIAQLTGASDNALSAIESEAYAPASHILATAASDVTAAIS